MEVLKAFIVGVSVLLGMSEKEAGLSLKPSSAMSLEDRSESTANVVIKTEWGPRCCASP